MIEIERNGQVTVVRMMRGKANALNIDLIKSLLQTLAELERDTSSAVILTGQGSAFCAGLDLPALVEGGIDYARQMVPLLQEFFERFATFPLPLIAAVNGHAIAGGAILMFTCDQILCAHNNRLRIGVTETLVGVPFPAWPLEICRFFIPKEHFGTVIQTGRIWPAEESLNRGLIHELVSEEHLMPRALAVAEELSAIDPEIFAATKRAVRLPLVEAAKAMSAKIENEVLEGWTSERALKRVAMFAHQRIGKASS